MPRIAQICTYYRTKFSGGGPQTPFQYNFNRDIEIEHNYTVFLKCIILYASIPYLALLRRCDLLFVWFFFCFLEKSLCAPPPHFSAPSYATGTFSAHKAKAQVHFFDHAQFIVLNQSVVCPSILLRVIPFVVRQEFAFSTSCQESLDWFSWILVEMKYSWSLKSVVVFRSYPPRGESGCE